MGLEQVKEEILARAKAEGNKIIAEAKAKANEYKKSIEKELKQFKETMQKETEAECSAIGKRLDAGMHLEQKRVLMDMKKKLLEELYKNALADIEKWSDKERKSFFNGTLRLAKKQMEIGIVYCNAKDKALISRELNSKEVKIQTTEIQGLIAENKDKTQSLDFTYASVMDLTKEKTLQSVGKILF